MLVAPVRRFTRTDCGYGSRLKAGTTANVVSTLSTTNALKNLHGTIALAGAGKMGGAMLTGWLAQGLDPRRVVVIEPHPSDEIKAWPRKASASTRRRRMPARSIRWWSR